MMKTSTGLIFLLLLCACSSSSTRQSVAVALSSFADTDSMELYVYPDPDNQHVFSQFAIDDTAVINTVITDLAKDTIAPADCIHYKKLFLFRKGEVFKTIYISDSCRYLAYIVDGNRIFRPMSGSLYEQLEQVIDHRRQ